MNEKIELTDIQLEVLKFMFENNVRLSKLGGYTKAKISHRVKCSNDEAKTAIEYLTDIKFLVKKKTSHKIEPSQYAVQGSYNPQKRTVAEERYRISPQGISFYEEEQRKMGITEQLKKAIDEDIQKLDNASDDEAMSIFHKYKDHVDGVNNNLTYGGTVSKKLKNVLEGFRLFGYQNASETKNGTSIHLTNSNENVNLNTINITITFEQVREDIKNNESLSQEKTDEIIGKIDELESIDKNERSRKNKWEKVGKIFNWITTQGVDIAVKLIPLVLKVISE